MLRNVPVAIIELGKLARLFETAAWWIACSENTTLVEKSALGHSIADNLARGFMMWQYEPSYKEAVSDDGVIRRETERMTSQFMNTYLDRLHHGGAVAAHAYARTIATKQAIAEQRVQAIRDDYREFNALTSRTTGDIARGLDRTIRVCEVLMAVGSLGIGMAGAGAIAIPTVLSGGTSAAMMGAEAFLLSSGYAFAGQAIQSSNPADIKAVAIATRDDKGFQFGAGTFVGGVGADWTQRGATKTGTIASKVEQAAGQKVVSMTTALGSRMPAWKRPMVVASRWGAGRTAQGAGSVVRGAGSVARVAGNLVHALPVIQFAADLYSAFNNSAQRLASLGPPD